MSHCYTRWVARIDHNAGMPTNPPEAIELSRIVEEAAKIAQASRREMRTELKPDGSIVTNGDRATEEFLRKQLAAFEPGAAVFGEEFGLDTPGAESLWVVDPIDGTSNFAFGSPLWAVSVALVRKGEIVLGAAALPDLGEMYVAKQGCGSYLNGAPLQPIPPGKIEKWELVSCGESAIRLLGAAPLPGKMRNAGSFVLDGLFVAAQRLRGLIGMKEKLYDIAAAVLVCLELGADVRYADGSTFDISALERGATIPKPWLIFPLDSGFYIR